MAGKKSMSFEYYDQETGFFIFVPDREVWDHWLSEADMQRDIDLELLLDEIELFEEGELNEKD